MVDKKWKTVYSLLYTEKVVEFTDTPRKGEIMNTKWGISEDQYIRNNAATHKDEQIAEKLSKLLGKPISTQAIRKRRQKLGIRKQKGRGKCALVEQEEKAIIIDASNQN